MGHHRKLPHEYARDYIRARGNPQEQKRIIESVPTDWIDLVRTHVTIAKERERYNDNQSSKNRGSAPIAN